MVKYENLKDYFQGEHIKLIKSKISKYMNTEMENYRQINDAVVQSLVCTYDDADFNVEVELGVLVEIAEPENAEALSFVITIAGNLELKFEDIRVINIKRVYSNEFPEDNILSQFILPDLSKSVVERIGSDMYGFYRRLGVFDGVKLSIESLVEKGMIFFSELPDKCLGRIILADSDVDVYYNDTIEKRFKIKTYHAKPGTILLNKKKYADECDGELRITVAHELVHLMFHSRFLKLLLLLGDDRYDLNSSPDIATINSGMTDKQKALCIAEWQANVLAMRLAIPSSTVDATNKEIANDPSTYYENSGDRMQACVIKFAKKYGVSCYVAKERLHQLGYDFVDGTIIEFDGEQKNPFYFTPGTLKENETFVIDHANYERLLRENKEFAELIERRHFVYTGYVVCFNHPKYTKLIIQNDVVKYVLSDYAREHAEECCYKFKYTYTSIHESFTEYTISRYLCKLEDLKIKISTDEDKEGVSLNAKQFKIIFDKIKEDMEKAEKTHAKMLLANVTTFSDALKYHKGQIKGLTYRKIEDDYGIPEDTLKAYVAPKKSKRYRKPSIEHMMLLCHAFRLKHDTAIDFLTKAGTPLDENDIKHKLYDDLLRCADEPIIFWNNYLIENGFSPFESPDKK